MKIPRKRFLQICEAALGRLQLSGFLTGDTVKFTKAFKSNKSYTSLHPSIQQEIDEMIDMGVNIKVVNIKNKYPSAAPGSDQNTTGDVTVDIALDYGGGRYIKNVSVPTDCLEVINTYPNLDEIPDAIRRDNQITLKPEPVEDFTNDQANKSDVGNNKLEVGDRKLAQQNIPIPASPAEGVPDPGSYTGHYMM